MKPYSEMTAEELKEELAGLKKQYHKIQALGIHLDMSRGKPSQDQNNLSIFSLQNQLSNIFKTMLRNHFSIFKGYSHRNC